MNYSTYNDVIVEPKPDGVDMLSYTNLLMKVRLSDIASSIPANKLCSISPDTHRLTCVRKIPNTNEVLLFLTKKHHYKKLPSFWSLMGMFGLGFGFGVAFFKVFQ